MEKLHFHTIIIFFLFSPVLSLTTDTITPTTPLTLNQTLVSKGNVFELGFFDPGNNGNWYIGIWYKQFENRTYVWVANRDTPVNSSSAKLTIGDDGNVVLLNLAETAIWTSNQSVEVKNAVAQLLDDGNFVLRPEDEANKENEENYVWESFKNPTDTLLPGMKLGWDRKTGVNRFLQSWKTETDPGSGDYSFKMNIDGFPEFFLLKKETTTKTIYRSGPWNGQSFSRVPERKSTSIIQFNFTDNADEISYWYEMKNTSVYSRLVMSSSGALQRYVSVVSSQTWGVYWSIPRDLCDSYMTCGPYGVCDANATPLCKCMKGFRPKNQPEWDLRDGSDGCVRSSKMDCPSDGFVLQKHMKLPESSKVYINRTMGLNECAEICKRNCSCAAYANTDIIGSGSGCVIWVADLLDLRLLYVDHQGGQDLYVRAAASDLENDSRNNVVKIVIIVGGTCTFVMILLILFYLWKKKMQRSKNSTTYRKGPDERIHDFLINEAVVGPSKREIASEMAAEELELPLFDYKTLVIATDNFSDANKLGQGGFGCVYKGTLMGGHVVAVKRLSKTSCQGIEELKNEVRLIAKLQHRNLVRLLGCCIEIEEKLLVYEYMENKSLNMFLFDTAKDARLDWKKRFDIIFGIARGLLYLHQDSRLRIIHRDLKASNILLDKEMNPKISDFGMARIFGGDQTEAETKKVVGTHGYMSPEYAMDGIFSVKSDVFSFGVLVLEIVTGRKNKGFYYASKELNLIGHIWNLWKEGNVLELIDESIRAEFSEDEVLRSIQIGLLCVQEHAEDRPNMSKVLLMLSSDIINLPKPKYPGFVVGKRGPEKGTISSQDESQTMNELTSSMLVGR